MTRLPQPVGAFARDRRDNPRATVTWWRPVVLLAVAATMTTCVIHRGTTRVPLPDFAAIGDPDARKAAFIEHLAPLVKDVDAELQAPRKRLLAIDAALAAGWPVDPTQSDFVRAMAERHGIEPVETIDRVLLARLLSRVDTVPASLVIAQAALESGWGTSRFARRGNALFGMRCHTPGCGMVPRGRSSGSTFEVAAYPSARDAIRAYVHNLNTDPRYRTLRRIRARLRADNQPVTGAALAAGLVRYSEKGSDYVEQVRALIQSNHLDRFDP